MKEMMKRTERYLKRKKLQLNEEKSKIFYASGREEGKEKTLIGGGKERK